MDAHSRTPGGSATDARQHSNVSQVHFRRGFVRTERAGHCQSAGEFTRYRVPARLQVQVWSQSPVRASPRHQPQRVRTLRTSPEDCAPLQTARTHAAHQLVYCAPCTHPVPVFHIVRGRHLPLLQTLCTFQVISIQENEARVEEQRVSGQI
uniref:Uncharacterized protein n=1 Tax=Cacopsylla melanoneura TaxID=428564 RepID=A0A8D8VEX3_9HEMI